LHKLTVMFDCQNGVSIDVQSYKEFATIDIAEPIVTDPNRRKISFRPNNYTPGRTRRHRRRAAVLQMAAVRHRPRLHVANLSGNQRLLTANRRIPERTLLGQGQ
jgi:hypothetical protein